MREPIVEPAKSIANPPAQPKQAAMEATAASEPTKERARAYDYDDLGESYDATD
jgi:hypothetical protein